jgi:hypothetical protein
MLIDDSVVSALLAGKEGVGKEEDVWVDARGVDFTKWLVGFSYTYAEFDVLVVLGI